MNCLEPEYYDLVLKDINVPHAEKSKIVAEFYSFLFPFRAVLGDAGDYDYF